MASTTTSPPLSQAYSNDAAYDTGYGTPSEDQDYAATGSSSSRRAYNASPLSVGQSQQPSPRQPSHPPIVRSRQYSGNYPMYSQSNTSASAVASSRSVSNPTAAPSLSDDFARSFGQMNMGGPGASASASGPPAPTNFSPSLGPQYYRSKSPGAGSTRSTGNGQRSASGSVDRANAMYAHQEMYQSASEIKEENSLAAIADEIDAAASEIRQGGEGGTPAPPANAGGDMWNWQQQQQQQQQQQSAYAQQHPQHQQSFDWFAQQQQQQQQSGGAAPGQWSQWTGDGNQSGFYAPPTEYYDPQTAAAYNGAAAAAAAAAAAGQGYDPNAYYGQGQGYGMEHPSPGQSSLARHSSGGSHQLGMTPMAPAPPVLYRQGTTLSMGSNHSGAMASSNARRRSKDAGLPQQTLPYNKDFVSEYRARMKADPDPEEQFRFARYLIEAAKKIQDPSDGPKQARKYRDSLLSESLKLIKKLATTGMGPGKPPYAEAQFFLANCFGNGSLGLQVDHEKAYNLYVQASKQNHPAATYRTAVCNEVGAGTRRDHHRAVLFYRKASALGDTAGMYKLGMVLLSGLLGQPRNMREAIVWLKRAAGQADEDNPHALHELGLLHEKPNSAVPVDEAYSRELYTQAAQLGYAPSQFKLGSAYEYGALTCPVDPRRSIAWYTKAAGKNDGESELALSGWYLTGSEGVLKQSDSEAYLWARRAAAKGIPKAEYAVGYYSEVGIGVKADLDEAKRWYMRAAAQGNKRAMQRLTELKKMGAKAGKVRPTRGDAEKECVVM
ncbi:unnamed protein product [Jaminaea pallidilutea]